MTVLQEFFLNGIYLIRRDSCDRLLGYTILFLDADDNIAASEIVDVICKGTDRPDNGCGVIPLLKLNTA